VYWDNGTRGSYNTHATYLWFYPRAIKINVWVNKPNTTGDPDISTSVDGYTNIPVSSGLFVGGANLRFKLQEGYTSQPYPFTALSPEYPANSLGYTIPISSIDLASVFSEYGNVRDLMGIHHIDDSYTQFLSTAFFVIGEDNASHYDGITGATLEVQFLKAYSNRADTSRVHYRDIDDTLFSVGMYGVTLTECFGSIADTDNPDNALTGFDFLSTVAVTTRRLTYTVKKSDATTNAYTRNSIPLTASQFEVYVKSALSADGNTLLIASQNNAYHNTHGGYVYVYRRPGTNFVYEGDLSKYDNVYPYDFYNYGMMCALSADGNTALVSGYGNRDIGTAYIWEYDGSSWSSIELPAPQSATNAGSYYGYSCALSADGSVALVSGHSGSSPTARFDAYLWTKKRDESGWVIDKHFENPSNLPYFGYSCALSGDGTVVLFTGPNLDTNTEGNAYIHWKQSDGTWSNQDLSVDNVHGAYGYACALSADGKVALITGHGRNAISGNYKYKTGTAWVWKFDGTNWYKDASLSRQDVSTYYGLSCSLSADGSIAMICGKASAENQNGQVYFWKDDGTSWSVISKHDLSSSTGRMGTHCSLSASGEYGIVTEQLTSVGPTCNLYQFKLTGGSITSVGVNIETRYATYSNVENTNSFDRVLYWNQDINTDLSIDDDSPFTNTYLNFGTVFGTTTTVHAQLSLSTSANVLGNVWMFGVTGSDSDNYSNIALQSMVTTILPGKTIQTDYITLSNVDDFELYLNDITLSDVFSAIDGAPSRITDLAANAVNAVIVALEGTVYHAAYKNTSAGSSTKTSSWEISIPIGSNIVDMTSVTYSTYTFDRASLFKDDTYGYNSVADGSGTLNYNGTVAIVTKPVIMPDPRHSPSNTTSNGGRAYIWKNFNNQWYHTNSLHDLSITDDLTFIDTYPHYYYRNYGKMCSLTPDGGTAIVLSDYRITVWDYDGSEYIRDTINTGSLTLSDFDVSSVIRRHNYMWCVIKKLSNNDLVILASGNYNNQYGFIRIFKKSDGSTTWVKLVDNQLYYNQGYIGTACDISDDGLVVLVTGPGIGQLYKYSDTSYTTITRNHNFYTASNHATYNSGHTLGWRCKLSGDGESVLLGGNGSKNIVRWDNVITDGGFFDENRTILSYSYQNFNNFSMSNDGNRLLVNVGVYNLDPLLFNWSDQTSTWALINKLARPDDEKNNGNYGKTLCVLSGDGTAALIGSEYETGNGSPYIYGNMYST
jgi:hypothetical protein